MKLLPPPSIHRRLTLATPAIAAIGLVFLLLCVGCMETRVVSSSWDSLREIADPPPQQNAAGQRVRGQAYAVELAVFTGRDRLQESFDFADRARADAQIADVWFVERGDDAVVYAGRFSRKNHPEAKAKLKSVRDAVLDAKRPFRKAKLVAIDRRQQGTRDQHDLSQYSGYRTLLLAVYDNNFGREFRREAEETADALRAEHDVDIYYYHGPNQSLITAGLFTQMDFVPVDGVDSYGPAIRQMQELFPHTQRNGEFLIGEDLTSATQREPTVIVRVP